MTARALITGIGGQDGSYLAERLVAEGMEVHALVLPPTGTRRTAPTRSSCTPATSVTSPRPVDLVREVAPSEVYNLAAISSVAQSWDEPDLTAHVNGQAAVALMESARLVGDVRRVVQASSAEIFGEPAESPQTESTPVAPAQPVRRREGLRPPLGRASTAGAACTSRARSSTTTSRRAATSAS